MAALHAEHGAGKGQRATLAYVQRAATHMAEQLREKVALGVHAQGLADAVLELEAG